MKSRSEILNMARETIHSVAPEATVKLYGSEARGDSSADSDMDFLVILPMERGADFRRKEREITEALLFDVELETGVEMSPYVVPLDWWNNHPNSEYKYNVENEGILL